MTVTYSVDENTLKTITGVVGLFFVWQYVPLAWFLGAGMGIGGAVLALLVVFGIRFHEYITENWRRITDSKAFPVVVASLLESYLPQSEKKPEPKVNVNVKVKSETPASNENSPEETASTAEPEVPEEPSCGCSSSEECSAEETPVGVSGSPQPQDSEETEVEVVADKKPAPNIIILNGSSVSEVLRVLEQNAS